jgi:DNA-binding transcriptional regulator GbsR (MarR family)
MTYAEAYREHLAVAPMSDFVDEVGDFFERFGLRRNLGRIWAALYLAPQPLTQAELADLLGLSAAMVSSSLKELSQRQAVRVVTERGSRLTRYEAEDQLLRTVATILANRELTAVGRLRDVAAEVRLAYAPTRHGKRLQSRLKAVESVSRLYEVLAGLVESMARLPAGAVDQTARAVELAARVERFTERALPRLLSRRR